MCIAKSVTIPSLSPILTVEMDPSSSVTWSVHLSSFHPLSHHPFVSALSPFSILSRLVYFSCCEGTAHEMSRESEKGKEREGERRHPFDHQKRGEEEIESRGRERGKREENQSHHHFHFTPFYSSAFLPSHSAVF